MVAVTLWAGRVATELSPEAWAFLRADDSELLPYDLQATLLHQLGLDACEEVLVDLDEREGERA